VLREEARGFESPFVFFFCLLHASTSGPDQQDRDIRLWPYPAIAVIAVAYPGLVIG
jgi:hypothetical protein